MLQEDRQDFGGYEILLALGSNVPSAQGSSVEIIQAASREISAKIGRIVAESPLFQTPAFPLGSGPDFVNSAIHARTSMSPEAVLAALHEIEASFDRKRLQRWAARTLDLDLLAYEKRVLPDRKTFCEWRDLSPHDQKTRAPDQLILPHPRIQDRAFVLVPLAEVAPDWRHPVSGASVQEMLDALPEGDKATIVKLDAGK